MPANSIPVPDFSEVTRPWQQAQRGGTAADRRLSQVTTSIPPHLQTYAPSLPAPVCADVEAAADAIARLDSTKGIHLVPLATLLLRAESVASSKIEHEEATVEDYAKALHGSRANSSATAMVAATDAIVHLLRSPITEESILASHKALMSHDPFERSHAGAWRKMQNWLEGSDYSPRGASYVPPPPELVPELMEDLLEFAHRTDLPAMFQAAVVHAQFESIHPFTDGNGRIGRALAMAILRERGVAKHVVLPIASALTAQRDLYFAALTSYRRGEAEPIVELFAVAARVAAGEALGTAEALRSLPEAWEIAAGYPKAGSATARVLDGLMARPIFETEELEAWYSLSTSSAFRCVERLAAAGIIHPLTRRKRSQVWAATDLLTELDDLGVRIASQMRAENRR